MTRKQFFRLLATSSISSVKIVTTRRETIEINMKGSFTIKGSDMVACIRKSDRLAK